MQLVIRIISNAFALWVATLLLSGVNVISSGAQNIVAFLIGGAVLAGVNMIVRPIVKTLSLPLYILTLGLFFLVVNALMLMLTSWISNQIGTGVTVDGFWWAVAGGIVIAVVNWVIDLVVPGR